MVTYTNFRCRHRIIETQPHGLFAEQGLLLNREGYRCWS